MRKDEKKQTQSCCCEWNDNNHNSNMYSRSHRYRVENKSTPAASKQRREREREREREHKALEMCKLNTQTGRVSIRSNAEHDEELFLSFENKSALHFQGRRWRVKDNKTNK